MAKPWRSLNPIPAKDGYIIPPPKGSVTERLRSPAGNRVGSNVPVGSSPTASATLSEDQSSWFSDVQSITYGESNWYAWLSSSFVTSRLKAGFPVYERSCDGYSSRLDPLYEYTNSLGSLTVSRCTVDETTPEPLREASEEFFVVSDSGLASMELDRDTGNFWFRIIGTDSKWVISSWKKICEYVEDRPTRPDFHYVVRTAHGYEIRPIGRVHRELRRGNYTPSVIEKFDHAVTCLKSDNPCGRLVLLHGPPGTGKSYMLRALPNEVDATYVLIPAGLLGNLSSPEMITTVLRSQERKTGPTVLIIEDADVALVSRSSQSDLPGLSEVLNLGDGLLGEMADIRILATTNASRLDLDEAVTRPGRLCANIYLDLLTREHAQTVYRDLTEKEGSFPKDQTSLAEIYRMARGDGWKELAKEGDLGQYL